MRPSRRLSSTLHSQNDRACISPTGASKSLPSDAAGKPCRLDWLADRLRDFVDLPPEFEAATDRLATWLARLDDED